MEFFLKKSLTQRLTKKIFFALGLFTIVLGISMAIKTTNYILMLSSVVLGTIIGEHYDWDTIINTTIESLHYAKDKDHHRWFFNAFFTLLHWFNDNCRRDRGGVVVK